MTETERPSPEADSGAAGPTSAGLPLPARQALEAQLREQENLIANLDTLRKSAAIVASTLDPRQAAELILEQVARLIPYDSASVQLIEEDALVVLLGRGFPQSEAVIGLRFPLANDALSAPIRNGQAPYVIHNDVRQFSAHFRSPPHDYIHSWMAVPLRSRGELIGIITLDGRRPGQFEPAHAELLLTFADQVAIALENARLFQRLQAELEERRRTEAALKQSQEQYQAYIALSADAILHIEFAEPVPTDLPESEQIARFMRQGEVAECNLAAATLYGYQEPAELVGKGLSETPIASSPVDCAIIHQFIRSGYRLLDWESSDEVNGRMVHFRSNLLGVLESGRLARLWVIIHDDTERKLAEQKAAQSARQLAMLNEIGRVVSEETDLQAVLEAIRQQLEKLVDFDFYSVRIFNRASQTASYLAVYESGRYWSEPDAKLAPGTPAYQVYDTGRSFLHLLTAEEIERDRQRPDLRLGDRARITTSLIFVPLKKKGQTIGALSVQRYRPNAYTPEELQLVEDVAIQVTIAIENARLFASLQGELEERRNAEEQVRQLNEELERRVHERTAQLELANRELEAFSYSVSHDLRAPLRAINGFSLALKEDYGERLDETAQDYLAKIRLATRSMGQLIDNLLNLARITRSEMNLQEVDLSRLVAEILANLQASEPGRQAEFIIQPGLKATADEQLLRVMLTNLCANAWKFTGKKPLARIEFGQVPGEDQAVYFLRDNGAGFNMTYVGKLFESFQRLHGPHEFEGTGIGLAIVKRIAQRHGGRAWAEGAVEQGATFYFTLSGPRQAQRGSRRGADLAEKPLDSQ